MDSSTYNVSHAYPAAYYTAYADCNPVLKVIAYIRPLRQSLLGRNTPCTSTTSSASADATPCAFRVPYVILEYDRCLAARTHPHRHPNSEVWADHPPWWFEAQLFKPAKSANTSDDVLSSAAARALAEPVPPPSHARARPRQR